MASVENATVCVDRYVLAEIRSDRAMTDAVAEMAIGLREIWSTEALLETLLDRIVAQFPAERGVVMIAGSDGQDLKSAVFHGNPFNADRDICLRAYRDSTATLQGGTLCAPLWMDSVNAGAVYVQTQRALTREDFHLFIALAAQAAWRLEYTRRLDSLQAQKKQMKEYIGVAAGIVGKSPEFVDLRQSIAKIAGTPTTVLILGEPGTGKELIARAIHDAGRGKDNEDSPFVAINCAAIPEGLFESELLGHEKGSFTGALARKIGKIEQADGGTLFLDEIGDMPLLTQAKLLRVIQERAFQRLGGMETIKVDVRILAATNRDLKQAVKDGTFRQDLYDRLNVILLRPPSLREVREDIPALTDQFIHDLPHVNVVSGVAPEVRDVLLRYHWPGNARQLKNFIERALNYVDRGGVIQPEHLPDEVWEQPEETITPLEADVIAARNAAFLRAMKQCDNNVPRACALLGISVRHGWRLKRELFG